RLRPSGNHPGLRIEGLSSQSVSLVRLFADEDHHSRRRLFGRLFVHEGGPGARAEKRLEVFPVLEEADIFRAGGFEGGYIATQPPALLRMKQCCPTQGRKHLQRKGSGSIKETWVGHLPSVAVGRPTLLLLLFGGCAGGG